MLTAALTSTPDTVFKSKRSFLYPANGHSVLINSSQPDVPGGTAKLRAMDHAEITEPDMKSFFGVTLDKAQRGHMMMCDGGAAQCVTLLKEQGFVDERTRAVFVEFSGFSETDSFVWGMRLVMEYMPSGTQSLYSLSLSLSLLSLCLSASASASPLLLFRPLTASPCSP